MFIGVLMNYFYPIFGITKPISEIPLIVTITAAVSLLGAIYYFRDKDFEASPHDIKCITSPSILLFLLVPFISVFGVILLDYYGSNVLLIILLIFLCTIPLLVAFNVFRKELYPFILWMVSISLVLYNALPTKFMRSTDNLNEYFLINLVIQNGIWDSTIVIHNINSMPGIVLLPAIFTILLKIDLISFYKVIAPILASLVPLGLYEIYRHKWDENAAFLSSFFYLSLFSFFGWASVTMKMIPSLIFFVLLIILIVYGHNLTLRIKNLFLIVFAFSLAVSHYGTSYLFALSLIIAICTSLLFRKYIERKTFFSYNFVALFCVALLSWNIYTTAGCPFFSVTRIFAHAIRSIYTEFIFPERSYGTALLFGETVLSLQILKYLYLISGFLIAVGLLNTSYIELRNKTLCAYTTLSVPYFLFLLSPYIFAVGQYEVRIWSIAIILLAPFLSIGTAKITNLLGRKAFNKNVVNNKKIVSLFLLVFLMFNSGFAQEVFLKENCGPISYISKERIQKEGNIYERARFYEMYIEEQDVTSAAWLANKRSDKIKTLYSDAYDTELRFYFPGEALQEIRTPFLNSYPDLRNVCQIQEDKQVNNSYIHLRYFNIIYGAIAEHRRSTKSTLPHLYNITEFSFLFDNSNKIYSNGGSEIYYR